MPKVTGVWLRSGVIVAITLLSAAVATPASGAKADLAVTKVAGAPASAMTGVAPALKVTVKNEGRGASKRAKLFARVLGDDGLVVAGRFGKGSVPPIDPRKTRKVTFRPKVPYEAIGDWRLGVCVAPGRKADECGQTGLIAFSDGSTIGRIDAALADGEISAGQALLYKLYAVSGDQGLPPAYDGGGPLRTGVIAAEITDAYASLPGPEKAALEPYFLQPRYAESAWLPGWARKTGARRAKRGTGPCGDVNAVSGSWSGIESAHAVFWHRPGNATAQAKAQSFSSAFEGQVWPDLTGAFTEVDDSAAASCDPAGDSRIDFYIDSGNALVAGNDGVAPSLPFSDCGPNPSFVVLPQDADRWAMAHEFMHVIQHAYRACERAGPWVEGTATWAAHYVFEGDNFEHRYKGSITTPFFSLRDEFLSYDAWPFWYSLEVNDDVDAIVRVYEALGSTNFAGALEQGPSDGLDEAWKRYSVERWNQVPIGAPGFPLTESFRQADGFTAKPAGMPTVDVRLGGLPERLFPLPTFDQQRPLSTWFHKVKITDRLVRGITVDLEAAGTMVQAFLKLQNGNWRLEDWSSRDKVDLCRDESNENVVEMVLATANASPSEPALPQATHELTAKDVCEPVTYSGTYSGTSRFTGPAADWTTNFDGTLTLTPYDGPFGAGRQWEITAGTLSVTSFDGTIGECSVSGGGGFSFPAFNQVDAPAMALSQGRYYLNIPWVQYFPSEPLTVSWGPPGSDCEDADPEYPVEGVGQFLTITPVGGIEPDEEGVIAVTDVSFDADPNWEHDGFEFTLTPVP